MRKFKVKVNGNIYDVEIEEIGGTATAPVAPVAAPAQQVMPQAPAAKAPIAQDGNQIKAPLPGNILECNVKAGDSVKSGQVLFILEAMKMENEILAPADGKVVAVNAAKGDTVNTGDVLVTLA